MPIHDWTRVDVGLFHDFHQDWTVELCRRLNSGCLPPDLSALIDPLTDYPVPDAHASPPPRARFIDQIEEEIYAWRANRLRIQHRYGQVVAIIQILSPGHKNSRSALDSFVHKAIDLMHKGVHLLIVDLFPPTDCNPLGIHEAIWSEVTSDNFKSPPEKTLTIVSYCAAKIVSAYVEPIAVGDAMRSMPVFLAEDCFTEVPLEEAYQASWAAFPKDFKTLLE